MRLANLLAKYSVDRWNRIRPLRRICRIGYQKIGEYFADSDKTPLSKWHMYNTYTLPYRDDVNFADWPEDSIRGNFTLVTDPAGFVVRHSTSYCAWKIRELTGYWPRIHNIRNRYHAGNWLGYLTELGYTKVVPFTELKRGRHYIGIDKSVERYGLVVWLEDVMVTDSMVMCVTSTYRNRNHTFIMYSFPMGKEEKITRKVTWVEIG